MKKRIALALGAGATAVAMLPLFAAFEAHVINVTARIENALFVPVRELSFGTVFPQEKLDKFFDVQLSQSFRDENRVDDVDYFIRQKPKCWDGNEENPIFGHVTEGPNGTFVCKDEGFELLPLLCPYLSKHEVSEDGSSENDQQPGIPAFHGPINLASWTLDLAKAFDVKGHLAKSQQDFDDTWNIDLKVPCFGGYCAQDWEEFVTGINPNAVPAEYVQPIENEHKLFGCDLWLEVGGISLPGIGCNEEADIMLVLDRSGSIGGAMPTLISAAQGFVTALQLDGVHAGMASFASDATLDVHLTNDETALNDAIGDLLSSGATFLEGGIKTATDELANPGDGHDRPDGSSPDFMVIVTDGVPNVCDTAANPACVPANAAADAADAARAAGIQVFVVGVGGQVDEDYLENEIAGGIAGRYFSAADFDALEDILAAIASCPD